MFLFMILVQTIIGLLTTTASSSSINQFISTYNDDQNATNSTIFKTMIDLINFFFLSTLLLLFYYNVISITSVYLKTIKSSDDF